jgi:hypothetical protein
MNNYDFDGCKKFHFFNAFSHIGKRMGTPWCSPQKGLKILKWLMFDGNLTALHMPVLRKTQHCNHARTASNCLALSNKLFFESDNA